MLGKLIEWSARNVFLVLLATVFVVLAGIYAVIKTPLDALPDLSDVQVIIYTEFLDPACETCAAFYPQVKKMMAANPDRIRLSVRHLPLHNGSLEVVKILEASRKQGKYWPTLEAVLASQSSWVSNHVARPERVWDLLGGTGLNLEQLRADMNSPDAARNLEQDRSDAKALNVTMTPEYFVNGRPLPDFGLAQLQGLVRDAVQSAYR